MLRLKSIDSESRTRRWDAKTMKGKGGCGGTQKGGYAGGGMVYMSMDKVYDAKYQLMYGK